MKFDIFDKKAFKKEKFMPEVLITIENEAKATLLLD